MGLSLIELMVVLAVLAVLVAVAQPSLADLLNRHRVQAVAEQIGTDLALARSETALRPRNALQLVFLDDAEMSCYTMAYFGAGPPCRCTNSGNACMFANREFKTVRVPKSIGVSFATWTPPDSGVSAGAVSFQVPQLSASPEGFTVTVAGVRGFQLRLELNAMGRVRTCTPNSSVGGVPAC